LLVPHTHVRVIQKLNRYILFSLSRKFVIYLVLKCFMIYNAEHKATKLMNHRRPKKRNPSDRRHKPAEYEPLPSPPPEFTVVSSK